MTLKIKVFYNLKENADLRKFMGIEETTTRKWGAGSHERKKVNKNFTVGFSHLNTN